MPATAFPRHAGECRHPASDGSAQAGQRGDLAWHERHATKGTRLPVESRGRSKLGASAPPQGPVIAGLGRAGPGAPAAGAGSVSRDSGSRPRRIPRPGCPAAWGRVRGPARVVVIMSGVDVRRHTDVVTPWVAHASEHVHEAVWKRMYALARTAPYHHCWRLRTPVATVADRAAAECEKVRRSCSAG
jgi:hypothetical protein